MDFGFFWYMARFSIHEKYFEALGKLYIRITQYLYKNYIERYRNCPANSNQELLWYLKDIIE